MSVTIRMSRHGAKKKPFYRIVVSDQRFPRDGRYIEQVGTYDPRATDAVKLDHEKIRASLNVGCTHCGMEIPPNQQVRIDFEHLSCPGCGQTFTPEKRAT